MKKLKKIDQDIITKRKPIYCPIKTCKCVKGLDRAKWIGWDYTPRAGPRVVGLRCPYNKVPEILVELE
jgi:hypothetical protein